MIRRYLIGLAQENNRLHFIGLKTFTKSILDYYIVIKILIPSLPIIFQ